MLQDQVIQSESFDFQSKGEASIIEIASAWANEKCVNPDQVKQFIFKSILQQAFYEHVDTVSLSGFVFRTQKNTSFNYWWNDELGNEEREKLITDIKSLNIISSHVFIPKEVLFSILRWKDGTPELERLGGIVYFWGAPWEGYPISWDSSKEAQQYSLYDALYYLSCIQDFTDLRNAYIRIPEYRDTADRNFNFLPIKEKEKQENEDEYKIRKRQKENTLITYYNCVLKRVLNKFINHFKEGRLEMTYALKGGSREIIHPDDITVMIESEKVDFLKSSANIYEEEILGIEVRKALKGKLDIISQSERHQTDITNYQEIPEGYTIQNSSIYARQIAEARRSNQLRDEIKKIT
ncbi:hypothetical protein [Candidatus Odyssella thessalonicensis]|uniref:hypothetical protein n=1 Tax=Candidatus Odyssella thessalonicensis TaxID=84647 RepID=UPI000225ACA4|nr:hypothetical protein [Candidatus Odyssella thessalonicensis]